MLGFLLAIQCVSIVVLFVETVYIFQRWRSRLQGLLLFSCLVTLINNVGYLVEMLSNSYAEYMDGLHISYLGRAYIPFALLLFCLHIGKVKFNKVIALLLGLIHTGTVVLVFTAEHQNLYYTTIEYVQSGIFDHIECGHGIWYQFYSILIVFYIFIGIGAIARAIKKETNAIARKRLFVVEASIAVESLFYILGLIGNWGNYDMTIIGYTLGAIIMGVAIFKYDLLDTLELAREFVIDDIPEGVVVYDHNGNLEFVNNVAQRIFCNQMDRENMKKILEDHIGIDNHIDSDDHLYLVDKKRLVHKDTYRGDVYLLIDDTEHLKYINDLKEQKDIAEEARAEAEQASASKSAFVSVVSHEIRTPMNAVVGMTELLLNDAGKLDQKQRKYLENIHNSGKALVMIVNDILDQSKIEAGKMELVEDDYELKPLLSDVMLIIENRIDVKPIKLILENDDSIPQVLNGDSLRIRQILINLMNNAVKFTEQGFIKLIVECVSQNEDKCKIKFTIKDTGQGIKKEDLDRLGQAFSQVDKKKNHGKEGTGLGLSISKDFISMMGGQLEVSSVYGEGSEFYFTIDQGIVNVDCVGNNDVKAEDSFVCPKAKVLVVDDNTVNLMIVKEMFKPLQMTIDTSTSGQGAIDMLGDNHYDLIFMDYMMPYMDGIETTDRIRKLKGGEFKDMPIIAMSGDDSDSTRDRFIEAGVSDFADKPINMSSIKKQIVKWLPAEMIEKI